MVVSGPDPPDTVSPAQRWRSLAVGIGLFCFIAGLFLAAGIKEAVWPKMIAVAGIVVMIIGGLAAAVMSRTRTSGQE